MKTVLAYGDSLTWGYDPVNLGRHAHEDRWTSVLQKALGHGVRVIAEGLNGRTTAYDDHLGDCERNGVKLLPTILATHKPIDLVIFLLGTNDMKRGIGGSAIAATKGIDRLIKLVRHHDWGFGYEGPDILLVSPPAICETASRSSKCFVHRKSKARRTFAALHRMRKGRAVVEHLPTVPTNIRSSRCVCLRFSSASRQTIAA